MKTIALLAALAAAFPLAAQAAPAQGSRHAGHTPPAQTPTPGSSPTKDGAHTGHAGHGSGEHKDCCACCKDMESRQTMGADKPAAPAQPGSDAHDHH